MSPFTTTNTMIAPTKPVEESWESIEYEGLPAWTSVKNTFIDCPADRSWSLEEFMDQKCKSCPASGVDMRHPLSKVPLSEAIVEESDMSTTDGTRTPPMDANEEVEEDSWEDMTYGELPVWTAVKNTFIDCPADRAWSLEEFLKFEQKCKSCPSSGVMMHPASKPPQSAMVLEDEELDTAAIAASSQAPTEEQNDEKVVIALAAILGAQQGPVFSVGSQAHHYGQCMPCGFVHKPGGCTKGASCPFCHLCPAGTIKAKKQMKKGMVKMQKMEAFAKRQQMYMGF